MDRRSTSGGRLLFSGWMFPLAIGVCFFALVWGHVLVFPDSFLQIGISSTGMASIGVALLLGSYFGKGEKNQDGLLKAIILLTLFYFTTELPQKPHGFAQAQFPLLIWVCLALFHFLFFRSRAKCYLISLAGVTIIAAWMGFLYHSGGQLIFTDDHPSFLYRLIQLRDNFPNIPFYNPGWNGGVEAREFFASGVLNVFFLFSPIIYLFDPTIAYTYMVLGLLFLVIPLFNVATAKLLKLPMCVTAVYILLSLSSSFFWYRWALHYGTLGFICSSALIPLNVTLFGLLIRRGGESRSVLYFVAPITATLMLFWSPSGLLMLPLMVVVIGTLPSLVRQPRAWIMLSLLLILNLPWMATFMTVSKVGDFVASTQSQEGESADGGVVGSPVSHDPSKFRIIDSDAALDPLPERLFRRLRTHILPLNPLVLLFGIPGLFYLRDRRIQAAFGCVCIFALFLGILGPSFKPQLELERMIVVLGFLLALPASLIIGEIVTRPAKSVTISALMGLIALTPFWIWRISSNSLPERYAVASPLVSHLVTAIKNNANGGRILFAGFILHELSEGHIAPLAAWSGEPLIASSYQHDRWRYFDIIPLEFRKEKQDGVFKYLDLMNVSSVITHDKFWRKWFASRPEYFEKVWEEGKFKLFRRKQYSSNYFLEGTGKVLEQRDNSVFISLSSDGAVVKFNYLPFLKASNCSISPAPIGNSLTFVRLSNCKAGVPVEISASGMLDRFFGDNRN